MHCHANDHVNHVLIPRKKVDSVSPMGKAALVPPIPGVHQFLSLCVVFFVIPEEPRSRKHDGKNEKPYANIITSSPETAR